MLEILQLVVTICAMPNVQHTPTRVNLKEMMKEQAACQKYYGECLTRNQNQSYEHAFRTCMAGRP